jgi:hypothetical protein
MALLYYINQGSGLWNDATNWFYDEEGSYTPYGFVPDAYDVCTILSGQTIDEFPSYHIDNVLNDGIAIFNNKTAGTVTNNFFISANNGVMSNNSFTGRISTNNGTVGTNGGTIATNSSGAYININSRTIITNSGTLVTNNSTGTVTTNTNSGVINSTTGTVSTNNGSVTILGGIGGGTGIIAATRTLNIANMTAGTNVTLPSVGAITVW